MFEILVKAASSGDSIENTAKILKNIPTANNLRDHFKKINNFELLEAQINQALKSRMTAIIQKDCLKLAIDLKLILYYGKASKEELSLFCHFPSILNKRIKRKNYLQVSRAMDVELQILKHLARDAHPTVAIAKRCCEAQIVDEYCAEYKDLFKEVRNYECFKNLHMGIISTIKGNLKKTLGDLYGLRTWVEYGFRQCKQELGWTDYRFTNFQHIERW